MVKQIICNFDDPDKSVDAMEFQVCRVKKKERKKVRRMLLSCVWPDLMSVYQFISWVACC